MDHALLTSQNDFLSLSSAVVDSYDKRLLVNHHLSLLHGDKALDLNVDIELTQN